MKTSQPPVVTTALIERNKTAAGGWKQDFIEAIGETWPPAEGWQERALGREVRPRGTRLQQARWFMKQFVLAQTCVPAPQAVPQVQLSEHPHPQAAQPDAQKLAPDTSNCLATPSLGHSQQTVSPSQSPCVESSPEKGSAECSASPASGKAVQA